MGLDLMWPDQLSGSKNNSNDQQKHNSIKKIQNNILFFSNIEGTIYWINLDQPKLICQVCDHSSNETMVNSYKEN